MLKTFFVTAFILMCFLQAGTACAESDVPSNNVLCENDGDCAKLGSDYKCLPQKRECGPAVTCAKLVCVKDTPKESTVIPIEETETDCKQKGGQWQGTVEGRGRLTGCNMPTKDGGKPCTKAEDCESVCLLDGICHGWMQYKGCAFFKGNEAMCEE